MAKLIGHFPLALQGESVVTAPENCAFLNVAQRGTGDNVVYAWVNNGAQKLKTYRFYCAFTGERLPAEVSNVAQFLGTIHRKDNLVIHVFQIGVV